MQTILFNILLLLTVIWLLVGIFFLWQQLHTVRQKVEEESKKKNKQKQKQSTSSVTQDQVEQARQILVGKSKSYREWKSHTNLTHPGKYFRPSKVKIMRPTSPK